MCLDNKKKLLKDFAAALSLPVGLTDSAKWPMNAGATILPVRHTLSREFFEQLRIADTDGFPDNWRKAFWGPTQIWRLSHHLVSGLIESDLDKSLIANNILILLDGVSFLCKNQKFHDMGAHLILDSKDVNALDIFNSPIELNELKKLLFLSGLLWSYSETNYFVAHELTCEYHGPYQLENGTYAVIRDYANMCPRDLWDKRDYSGIPVQMQIVTIHSDDLEIEFDVYNNLYDKKGTMRPSMISGYAMVDSHICTSNEIDMLISLISDRIRVFTCEVNELSKSLTAHKYLDVFWYRKKSLADFIGVKWEPHQAVHSALQASTVAEADNKARKKPTVEDIRRKFDFSDYV